jgi:hypothetical protein
MQDQKPALELHDLVPGQRLLHRGWKTLVCVPATPLLGALGRVPC